MLSEKERSSERPEPPTSPFFSYEICPYCERDLVRNTVGELCCITCCKVFADPKVILATAEKQIQHNSFTSHRRFIRDFEALMAEEVFRYERLVAEASESEIHADLLFYTVECDSLMRELSQEPQKQESTRKKITLCLKKVAIARTELERRDSVFGR